jgi:AMP nucleosidase
MNTQRQQDPSLMETTLNNHISKEEIVTNWLPRNTKTPLEQFGEYIIIVNFKYYVESFAKKFNAPVYGIDINMQTCTANNITIINMGIGSPAAAQIMDLLIAIQPKAVLFLGKCGSLKDNIPEGSFIVPNGCINKEVVLGYFPPEVPSMPSFPIQRAVSHVIKEHGHDYFTGVIYSTNRRVWEHDLDFKKYLEFVKATAIDMETATLFSVGFFNSIPTGALLLVSDRPMLRDGVKTEASDKIITANYGELHLELGIKSITHIRDSGASLKHLKW